VYQQCLGLRYIDSEQRADNYSGDTISAQDREQHKTLYNIQEAT